MHARCLALLGLVLAVLGAPLGAEEPAAPTPAQRTAQVLEKLGKLEAGAGLSFVGEMLDQGTVLGQMSFSVAPAHAGSPAGAVWQAIDELKIGPDGTVVHVRLEALLDARLAGLEGTTTSQVEGEVAVTLTWKRDASGYAFTRQEGEAPATTMHLDSAGGRVPTMAALVFLALYLPAEGGPHSVDVLLVDANLGEDAAVRAAAHTLTPQGTGIVEVAGVPTKLPRVGHSQGREPAEDTVLALAADGKGLVQIDRSAGGVFLRLPRLAPPFDFGAPASTAPAAALKVARAIATGDMPALDALMNWANFDIQLASRPDFRDLPDAATRRAKLLKQEFEGESAGVPAEPIEMILRGMTDALKTEDLGKDRVRVIFPPLFSGLKLVVKKVGEVWLLDELPGKV